MIRTRQLQYAYPGGEALIFPDVDVPQGTVLLLSGPSGCGKSTWLALVAALVTPSAGELTVAGQPLGALKNIAADAWRASAIGFLPQKLHLSAALTVRQPSRLLKGPMACRGEVKEGARRAEGHERRHAVGLCSTPKPAPGTD